MGTWHGMAFMRMAGLVLRYDLDRCGQADRTGWLGVPLAYGTQACSCWRVKVIERCHHGLEHTHVADGMMFEWAWQRAVPLDPWSSMPIRMAAACMAADGLNFERCIAGTHLLLPRHTTRRPPPAAAAAAAAKALQSVSTVGWRPHGDLPPAPVPCMSLLRPRLSEGWRGGAAACYCMLRLEGEAALMSPCRRGVLEGE